MKDMRRDVSSTLQNKPWLLAAAGLALGLVCFGSVAGSRLLSHLLPAPGELPAAAALPGLPGGGPAGPATPAATPTPACAGASLTIGTSQFQVQSFVPAQGGLAAPAGTPGVAFWVEGTQDGPLFVLAALPENQALLAAVQPGDPAVLVWQDCNTATYTLAAPGAYPADPAALLGGAEAQLAVLLPPGADSPGGLLTGGLQGELLLSIPTQPLEQEGVLAEVSLLEAGPAEGGAAFEVQVAVYNYGEQPFELDQADVALLPAVGSALAPESSRPRLPQRVRPGETREFAFSFAPPGPGAATLRILGVEYDVGE